MSKRSQEGRPPVLSSSAIAKLIKDHFHFLTVDEESVKELPSYVDRNIYFRGILEHPAPVYNSKQEGNEPNEYVLKLNNPFFASHETLTGINSLLEYLRSNGIAKSIHPLIGRQGQTTVELTGQSLMDYENEAASWTKTASQEELKRKYFLRIVTFIPGECLDHINKQYLTYTLLYDIGSYIGKVDAILRDGFYNEGLKQQDLLGWDFNQVQVIRKLLPDHDDLPQRKMVERVLNDFEKHVTPLIPAFQKGFMYGDASGQNIIVKKSESGDYELAGIIDFGHAILSCYVFDIGILLAYITIENQDLIDITPMEFVGPLLKGFVDAFPLTTQEIGSLYYITMVRLCQSAIIGTYNFKQEPWNAYFLTTPAKCWKLLDKMLNKSSKEEVDKIWDTALNPICSQ